jgi:hypothetical protein
LILTLPETCPSERLRGAAIVDETPKTATGIAGRAPATGALGAARKVAVLVVGVTVLVIGVALIVLPGPAFLVIPAGLAILATEFLWARRLLRYAMERGARLLGRRRGPAIPGGS